MSLTEEYPKANTDDLARWRVLLQQDPRLEKCERDEFAMTLNVIADLATDLVDINQRLLKEPHTPAEVGELLIAIELTLEQIRGQSDVVDGKLYEIGDRLRGEAPSAPTPESAAETSDVGS